MLDLIIISYKLTINVSVTYQEYIQYTVDNTYNTPTVMISVTNRPCSNKL